MLPLDDIYKRFLVWFFFLKFKMMNLGFDLVSSPDCIGWVESSDHVTIVYETF